MTVLHIGGTQSHQYAWLVLNGPWAGTVWIDGTGYDGGCLFPANSDHLGEFITTGWWRPFVDEPWFPAREAAPKGSDFLDLTLAWLSEQVTRAELQHAFDRLNAATISGLRRRLNSNANFDFGWFLNVCVTRLLRDQYLSTDPDPAACARIVEITESALNEIRLPRALILAERWRDLIEAERGQKSHEGRSPVNLVLASVMLGEDPSVHDAAVSQVSDRRKQIDRRAVLHALTRMPDDRQRQVLVHLSDADSAELRQALAIAAAPIDADSLDAVINGLLTGDQPKLTATAVETLVCRALSAMAADPALGALAEHVCVLASWADRLGEVFDHLTPMSGDRWPNWRAAERDAQRWIADRRPKAAEDASAN